MLYEFRVGAQDYSREGRWHLMHWSPSGLFSVCGHSRARFDNVQGAVQFDRATTLEAARTKTIPGKGQMCHHCAHIITQTKLNPDSREVRGADMLPGQEIMPEQENAVLDPTKPIIVVNGSTRQAEEKTLAAAKALAKEIIGDAAATAVIFVPHTKVARPVPPLKATRIKFV